MKALWSPWRLEYVTDPKLHKTQKGSCVFCDVYKQDLSEESLLLYRDPDFMVLMNRFPYSTGHLMVIPKAHVPRLRELSPAVLSRIMCAMQACVKVLEEEFSAEGINLGLNQGVAAGAGIVDHLHFHVVPRWCGDTNFMPVIAEVKCIPEHIRRTYKQLEGPIRKAVEGICV